MDFLFSIVPCSSSPSRIVLFPVSTAECHILSIHINHAGVPSDICNHASGARPPPMNKERGSGASFLHVQGIIGGDVYPNESRAAP